MGISSCAGFSRILVEMRLIAAGIALLVLGGCSVLPTQGPSDVALRSPQRADLKKVAYVVVELTPDVIAYVARESEVSRPRLPSIGRPRILVGVGDMVAVSIFEEKAGGLFIPSDAGSRPGNFVEVPPQQVDQEGYITVPYAGRIRANRRTRIEIQQNIEELLRDRAIAPQVVVALADQRSSRVTVGGDVNSPIVFSLNDAGDRVLDAIARAGGSKYLGQVTFVTIQRDGREFTIPYNQLIQVPGNNVYLKPGDTIDVHRDRRKFLAFGAIGQAIADTTQASYPFETEVVTLAEALARVGGVLDSRGDAKAVYLYRLETKDLVQRLGYDTAAFVTPTVPVIYRLDLSDPGGFFAASRFIILDSDILYVANAPSVDMTRLLEILNLAAGTARQTNLLRTELRD